MVALSIGTLNTHGSAKDRLLYVNKMMQNHDIMLIQEHWLHNEQLTILQSEMDNVCVHGISGMHNSTLLHGRPFGGCAILWRRDLKCSVTPVSMATTRACGAIMSMEGLKLLIISVYMPTDSGSANIEQYKDTLNVISATMNTCDISNVIIGGDFNADLARTQSQSTRLLNKFVESEALVLGNLLSFSDCDYTFESKASGARSIVDHFLFSQTMHHSIQQYFVSHDGDNLSDHSLLSAQLDVTANVTYIKTDNGNSSNNVPVWTKASHEQLELYKIALDNNLSDIRMPWQALQCNDTACSNEVHLQQINAFHNDIIDACIKSSDKHIPIRSKSAKSKPGWVEHVQPHKETALFWHQLWKDNGCPRDGIVADIRRRTRARYHLAIKQLKHNEDNIRAKNMADAILNNDSRNFWTEVKKVRKANKSVPTQIDGMSDERDVANLFASKYETIYNSVSYNDNDMDALLHTIDSDIHAKCKSGGCTKSHRITPGEVSKCISNLKYGKHDGYLGHYTDHLINGTQRLHIMLSLLYSSMLIHGFTPEAMLLSTIAPIPKDMKKSLNDSTNYRGIALSSTIGKLLDSIIIMNNPEILSSIDIQFAYKEGYSTTQCTFAVNETVDYYMNNGSNVHVILLDATKAFDRVHYIKLFNELRMRNICPTLCKFLALQYTMQRCRIKWSSYISEQFTASNGVKQGGVLSPILFTVYMDKLLEQLKMSNVGCHIGHIFSGAFAYADDIILLSPTRSGMQAMINICETFSREYCISFNASKSKHVYFCRDKKVVPTPFNMQNSMIPTVPFEKHLGNWIGNGSCEKIIDDNIKSLYKNTNLLLSQFPKTSISTRYRLFKSYCMSVYGSQLWDYSGKHCNKFYIAWRKCIRRLLGIPHNTHCRYLHLICDDIPVDLQLHARFINFMKACSKSSSDIVRICSTLALNSSRSVASKSWFHICNTWNVEKDISLVNVNNVKLYCKSLDETADKMCTGLICDLLILRECDNDRNLTELIEELCTS